MNRTTPLVLIFAYNRPGNLTTLLDSIKNAEGYSKFHYRILIDGPKNVEESSAIRNVIEIARDFQKWLGEEKVSIKAQDVNLGLAKSVILGVSQGLSSRESVIVFEDDLEVSRKALLYFERGLEIYKEDKNVGAICGYTPFDLESPQSTFFLNEASSWGWATWFDRWKDVNWDAEYLYGSIVNSKRNLEFDSLGSYPFTEMLLLQIQRRIDSWAIRWQANLFLDNKLCLYPNRSLVNNLGFRGIGTHASRDSRYEVVVCQNFDTKFKSIPIQENLSARVALSQFYTRLNSDIGIRALCIRILVKIKKSLKDFGK